MWPRRRRESTMSGNDNSCSRRLKVTHSKTCQDFAKNDSSSSLRSGVEEASRFTPDMNYQVPYRLYKKWRFHDWKENIATRTLWRLGAPVWSSVIMHLNKSHSTNSPRLDLVIRMFLALISWWFGRTPVSSWTLRILRWAIRGWVNDQTRSWTWV